MKSSDHSRNSARYINDLAGLMYSRLMKISVSSSIFDSGIWNQLRNSPNLSEVESSCVISRVIPGLKNSRYQQDFLTLFLFDCAPPRNS